ncbi:uncharacterized protein MYCFIDRAFT_39289 [Pseudocercospora fijiensis CIRAD86]|uniref:Enoyl reductase (ER) domain-containing protein n=1 Tax=Pseudocercospora fijiensis (strain CIRAD86) TaxID=383855 RepID=M3B1U2_PSEFD|nr:uncharacterized protein MYCFIDRAFT_39289 [Pseudocercospora fijiensis CIRAD86]EME83328.1 hypothetical protein MYCFIDRAFT_39289 [Pseudocercospora fijiensis CIRAD86]
MGQERNQTNGVNATAPPIQPFVPDKANPALYTNEKREIFMADSPELQPGPNDCVVRMRCNGICGSDVHFWHTGRIGPLIVDCPHVLGHEGAGEVVWSGANVKHLKPGDRVAVEPGVPCDNCYQCSSGNYNLCADVAFSGVPPYSGSIRRWHVHPSKFLHKIPDNLSFSDGALLEPLSVVLHGFERAPIKLGEPTVICGAGPIGMCALAVAKASGAAPIIVTDLDAGRLKFAKEWVPNCIPFQIDLKKSAEETAKHIVQTCIDAGADQPRVVYECTGVQQSVVTACYLPRAAGQVMVIGVGKPIMNEIPFMHISLAEVDLKFINRYHHTWPSAISLLQHKVIDLQPLVTHRYTLDQARDALAASADRGSGSIKIHIEDNEP